MPQSLGHPLESFPEPISAQAMGVYAVLREFSTSLRLSPINSVAFHHALRAVAPTEIMDEVHVRLVRALFLDCMAIVRKFGSPHLFITVR